MKLWEEIWQLGKALVNCPLNCYGVVNDPEKFTPPRCLFVEPLGSNQIDCAVIGINPGKIKNKEKRYYQEHGVSYDSVYSYWHNKLSGREDTETSGHKYYREIRNFLKQVNLVPNGSILWTELCKCQSSKDEPPLQTFRTCSSRYLSKELELLGKETPLVGVGDRAYRAIAFSYPEYTVIGIPHPGSYGHWTKLIRNLGYMKKANERIKAAIRKRECIRLYPNTDLSWI